MMVVSVWVAGPSEVTGASVVVGVSEVVLSSELVPPHADSTRPAATAAANAQSGERDALLEVMTTGSTLPRPQINNSVAHRNQARVTSRARPCRP